MSSHYSTERENLLKVLTVINNTTERQSFTKWANQAKTKGNGTLLFGSDHRGKGSLFLKCRRRLTVLERSYISYITDPDSSSQWTPLDQFSSDPSNYLQISDPIRKLTKEEFNIQNQKGSSPDIQETMSRGRTKSHSHSPMRGPALNNESDAASQAYSIIRGADGGGHVYVEGKLASIVGAVDPETFQAICNQAKPMEMGKNIGLGNMWCVANEGMRTLNGGVVQAIHLKKQVSFADKEKFVVATCGSPNSDIIMIQMPVVEYEELKDLDDEMAALDIQTKNISESRDLAFKASMAGHVDEESRVYFVKLDHHVSNEYLQDEEDFEPESGKFTTYECGVSYKDEIDEYGIDQEGLRLYLHWELPLAEGYRTTTVTPKKKKGLTKDAFEKQKADIQKIKDMRKMKVTFLLPPESTQSKTPPSGSKNPPPSPLGPKKPPTPAPPSSSPKKQPTLDKKSDDNRLDPSDMKVSELRPALNKRGLSSSGTKIELVTRLQEQLKKESMSAPPDSAPDSEAKLMPPKSPRTGETKVPNKEEYKNKKISKEKNEGKKKQKEEKNQLKQAYVDKKRMGEQGESGENMNHLKKVIERTVRNFGL